MSTLLIGTCPGPPACADVHTYLFVDGLDLLTRSDGAALGLHPRRLLRPGGPLHPTDAPREARIADLGRPGSDRAGLTITVRLRGETVGWSGLMYPDREHGVVEEVRFQLAQYLGEVQRVYGTWR
ncbi:hypothetical protein AB0M19_15230 [Streptomyces sp. NPDC051920]|uniref:hypothetical protein n=1 Tax=Streptomyces sp. NPDC051920 TaxID=3155523 RepID=UPI003437C55C